MSTSLVERQDQTGGVVVITLNDPPTRNAMSEQMASEFLQQITRLRSDETARVVIIRGAGKAFSGGGHLEMLLKKTKLSQESNRELMETFYNQFLSITKLEVPVIAAINGHAVGAGLCLALGCDIRIAVKGAKLGFNFVRLGLHPGMGVTHLLPRLIGAGNAAELLYTGKIIDTDFGARIGLINHALEKTDFESFVAETAASIAKAGPQAIRELKLSLRMNISLSLADSLRREAECQAKNYTSEEFLEGITAAKEKRAPVFVRAQGK